MIVGFASGHLPLIPANQLLVKRASAIGVWWGGEVNIQPQLTERLLSEVNQFLVDKKVKPHIGQIFPLTKVGIYLHCSLVMSIIF
jgi:NADPH2:quinone reductase